MSRRIYKVQMPLDMERARKEGTMWVDQSKRPEMLIHQRGGHPRLIRDEKLWDAMMRANWVKAFWEAAWDGTNLTFLGTVEMQDW